jgi:hypothetical protein
MKRLLSLLGTRPVRYVPSAHQVPIYRVPTTRRRRGGIAPWLFVLSLILAFATGCLAASERSTGTGLRTSECSIHIEAPADAGTETTKEM